MTILARLANDFEYPVSHEGYNRILYLKPSDHSSPVYTCSEVADILKRVRNSFAVTSDIFSGASSFRGNLNRNYPGEWRRGFAHRKSRRNFNHSPSGSFRGTYRGQNVGVFGERRDQWVNKTLLEIQSASGGAGNEDRVSAAEDEGTGTTQDPLIID